MKNKIFILLPDGVGLRNFAYSNFYETGKEKKIEVVFWNNTPFQLNELGLNEIAIHNSKTHPLTDIYKNAKIQVELNLNIKKTKDKIYNKYRFPFLYNTINTGIKSIIVQFYVALFSSNKGLKLIRKNLKKNERKTLYYNQSLDTLKKENPTLVFCTNQRSMSAIAPILAAQDLGIPTACFIFSWDNLPKATMVIETDYYFVWSEHMKKELLFYYPYIQDSQIFVTGTPQFETHFDVSKIVSREVFFNQNNLDLNKKYLCYSGDDSTTCPDDPQYLEDVAKAVIELNLKGNDYGILFRRCPVDFSDRFDEVLNKYKNIIVPVIPKWEQKGAIWNTVLPLPEDLILQLNTIAHTEMVINLGSSMVFDYATLNKPCAYINYDVQNKVRKNWYVKNIYDFVHFRSMPTKDSVFWINNADEIGSTLEKLFSSDNTKVINNAKKWFNKINLQPSNLASERIWNGIVEIINK